MSLNNLYEPSEQYSDIKDEGKPYVYNEPFNNASGPFFLQYQHPASVDCSYYGLNSYMGREIFKLETILQFIDEYNANVRETFGKWVKKQLETQLPSDGKPYLYDSTNNIYEAMVAADFQILEPDQLDPVSLSIILSLDFVFEDGKFKITPNKFYPIKYADVRAVYANKPDRALFIKHPNCIKMLSVFKSGHVTAINKITDPLSKNYNNLVLLDSMFGDQTLITSEFIREMLNFVRTTKGMHELCKAIFRSGELDTYSSGGARKMKKTKTQKKRRYHRKRTIKRRKHMQKK